MTEIEYLLCCLSEELSEVQQEIGKCLRFTPEHRPAEYPTTNIERVRLEMADVYAITRMLREKGVSVGIVLPYSLEEGMAERFYSKLKRTRALMEVSRKLGVLPTRVTEDD